MLSASQMSTKLRQRDALMLVHLHASCGSQSTRAMPKEAVIIFVELSMRATDTSVLPVL